MDLPTGIQYEKRIYFMVILVYKKWNTFNHFFIVFIHLWSSCCNLFYKVSSILTMDMPTGKVHIINNNIKKTRLWITRLWSFFAICLLLIAYLPFIYYVYLPSICGQIVLNIVISIVTRSVRFWQWMCLRVIQN